MNPKVLGALIRRERLRREWSQEGLCRRICAVSYLSKIEQGKAEASPEVLRLLLERLNIDWNEEAADAAARCVERCYEDIFSGDLAAFQEDYRALEANWDAYANGPSMLDALVLRSWHRRESNALLSEFDLDQRQHILLLILQGRDEDAAARNPLPLTLFCSGISFYEQGRYPSAIEALQRCCDLSAQEGYVHLMADSRLYLGNCYSNLLDYDHMLLHYKVAERFAKALGDEDRLTSIRYNIAATALELGRVQDAYNGLQQLRSPTAMVLHKLAVCCEKLGRPDEALSWLDQAEAVDCEYPDAAMTRRICALVRFRLTHTDYLHNPEYGALLLETFRMMREQLPHGYAAFHLPWVLEWYRATRQYKQALELLTDFPSPTRYS